MWKWMFSSNNNTSSAPTASDIASTKDAISKSDITVKLLQKRLEEHKAEAERYRKEALAYNARGQKEQAHNSLREMHIMESKIASTADKIGNLRRQKHAMDDHLTQQIVYNTMKNGSEIMKQQQKHLSVAEVDNLSFDIEEQMKDAHTIDEALSKPFDAQASPDDADVDKLDAELEAMARAEAQADPMVVERNNAEGLAADHLRHTMPVAPILPPVESKNNNGGGSVQMRAKKRKEPHVKISKEEYEAYQEFLRQNNPAPVVIGAKNAENEKYQEKQ